MSQPILKKDTPRRRKILTEVEVNFYSGGAKFLLQWRCFGRANPAPTPITETGIAFGRTHRSAPYVNNGNDNVNDNTHVGTGSVLSEEFRIRMTTRIR